MSLQNWLDNAWVRQTQPSARTVSDLLAIAARAISDGSLDGISPDGRFIHAYDAVRSLCEAALHAAGYEVPKGARKHERLIQSLEFTLGPGCSGDVDFLDRCRRLRHQSLYDRTGVVQLRDADELLGVAKKLQTDVADWLRREHPHLVETKGSG